MLAEEYAQYYHMSAQGKDESSAQFKERVGSNLERMGFYIEAQEARTDERYETSDLTISAIFGMVNRISTNRGEAQDDVARGIHIRSEKQAVRSVVSDGEFALLAVMLGLV